ncbi:MAG: hypothetical protein A2937_02770 [Candidatus Yonathbacteria bacterium RIFCSPLOWO2_01_FULL_47_33b]|uniref:Uncharacterized protein n=1 Tax=Candidatus Yonathbacteria bacterium RIFCSPLOWO2_01_FULL_47_33b TaxID=1802727 RepID=A0A1G2SGM2_9BACT|nr:MAG: hypothetical protein A2937_02770 [Candidatus Yonathbacteria bacterium RIFCSPLOWO2_01_FULL_47_33b]
MKKIQDLYEFIDRAVKSRKYPDNTGMALKTALKLFEAVLNEEERNSIDVFSKNIEQIYQNVFSKNKNFSASSLATYKSRVTKVLSDYEKYGVDPTKMANWSPKVISRSKKISTNVAVSKDKTGFSAEIDNSAHNFEFKFGGGVKLLIPKTPETNDAVMDGELKDIKVALKDFSEKYCKEKEELNEAE